MKVALIAVPPIGKRKTNAFVTLTGGRCGGMREVEVEEYPDSPRGEELRRRRVHGGPNFVSIGEAGRRLGLTPSQFSGLETGRYTLSDADWEVAFASVAPQPGTGQSHDPTSARQADAVPAPSAPSQEKRRGRL